jgi:hypothetical protein
MRSSPALPQKDFQKLITQVIIINYFLESPRNRDVSGREPDDKRPGPELASQRLYSAWSRPSYIPSMNAPLGYALLRDRRVSLRPKLVALGVGLATAGLIELLQIPFESALALFLPFVGAAGDVALDGAEAVIVPVLVATLLMPYLAPPTIVQQLRAERAAGALWGWQNATVEAIRGNGVTS